jgi:hypothetical protein
MIALNTRQQPTPSLRAMKQSSHGNLRIEDFSVDRFAIQLNWRTGNMKQPQVTEICRPYYELWLQYTGRLDWCLQSRGDESPQNISGMMATEDYWENAEYEVKLSDLRNYILKEILAQKELN